MRARTSLILGLILILALAPAVATPAGAAEDADLDLIPDTVLVTAPEQPPAAGDGATRTRLFVELAPQVPFWRRSTVPAPGGIEPDWRTRATLDFRLETRLAENWKATLADRLDLILREGQDPEWNDLRNSFREGYVTWAPGGSYVDLGRVNVRNGVAQGFNPTDWFKADAVVTRVSEDPAVLREVRLGALMARGQTVWDGGSVTALFAPRVADGDGPPNQSAFAPGFDRTNRQNRGLVKGTMALAEDLSPELLFYKAWDEPVQIGANLTRGLGDAVVAYVEWNGGRSFGLVRRALRDAVRTGQLPATVPPALPVDAERRFHSQAAAGLSWTAPFNLTLSLEYHYNGAGLDRAEWRAWLDRGAADANAARQFWLIRRYAQEVQEPVTRDSLFVRASLPNAVVSDLDVTALARINPYDGSVFTQIDGAYYLSNAWTVALTLGGAFGEARSEYGTLAQKGSLQAKLVRYF